MLQTQITNLAVVPAVTSAVVESGWTRTHSCAAVFDFFVGLGVGVGDLVFFVGLGVGVGVLVVFVGLGVGVGVLVVWLGLGLAESLLLVVLGVGLAEPLLVVLGLGLAEPLPVVLVVGLADLLALAFGLADVDVLAEAEALADLDVPAAAEALADAELVAALAVRRLGDESDAASIALFGRLEHGFAVEAEPALLLAAPIASAWLNMLMAMNARLARILTAVGLPSRTLMRETSPR